MRRFLTAMKGSPNLYHFIGKSRDEPLISRKVYGVIKAVKEAAMIPLGLNEHDWWKAIKHNDVNGMAWVQIDVKAETRNVQVVKLKKGTIDLGHLGKHFHVLGGWWKQIQIVIRGAPVNYLTFSPRYPVNLTYLCCGHAPRKVPG